MKKTNGVVKAVLAVAILGAGGVLLRPMVAPTTAQAQAGSGEVGRYQLAVASGEVFVLDTKTGVLKGRIIRLGSGAEIMADKSFTATWETDYQSIPSRIPTASRK